MADPTPTGPRASNSPFEDTSQMSSKTMTQAPQNPTSVDPSDRPARIALNWAILIGGMAALMYLGNVFLTSF